MERIYEQIWQDACGNCVGHEPIRLKQDSLELGIFEAKTDVAKEVML